MTGSFLDEVKAARDAIKATSTKDLAIAGYGGRLWVRYDATATGRSELGDVLFAYQTGQALTPEQELQLLVDCCQQILKRGDGGELEPIDPDGTPLAFDGGDERWQTLLGIEAEKARDCVEQLFLLEHQPLAAAAHANVLVDWLQGLDREIAARAVGKSGAGTAGS